MIRTRCASIRSFWTSHQGGNRSAPATANGGGFGGRKCCHPVASVFGFLTIAATFTLCLFLKKFRSRGRYERNGAISTCESKSAIFLPLPKGKKWELGGSLPALRPGPHSCP